MPLVVNIWLYGAFWPVSLSVKSRRIVSARARPVIC
jgi:hypothetical protein